MGEFWKNLRDLWAGMARAGRVALVVAAVLCCTAAAWTFVWASRSNDQVLFSDLEPRDAAAIVDELKKMKVAYRIGGDGSKILVDGNVVHEVRLNLMAHGVPINGGVGFEIFDNKDVGMTESMQRINYQRALQGELARTIMANDQLKSARVHLVVEEGGLFSRDKTHPKAAVSVVLKPGAHLNNEQILGIQRLVAAAVPGLDSAQVTITDQRGVALSNEADTDTEAGGAPVSGKLRLKKQADEYLTRKVSEVLDRAFGPGQAIVSVDATLNFDEIHRTEQNILPVHGHGDEIGAVVRRRESIYRQPTSSQSAVKTIDVASDRAEHPGEPSGTLTSTSEVEYELGKSAEQILSTPGGIRRVSVGVIVPQPLSDEQLARVKEIVGMSVGFNADRGDAITVQPLSSLMAPREPQTVVPAGSPPSAAAPRPPLASEWRVSAQQITAAVAILITAVLAWAVVAVRRRAEERALQQRLSNRERQQLLREIQTWIDADRVTTRGAIKA